MYLYRAKYDEGDKLEMEFSTEDEARDYADQNGPIHWDYEIIDLEDDITIASSKMDKEIVDSSWKQMFPDEESEEGFDISDRGEGD